MKTIPQHCPLTVLSNLSYFLNLHPDEVMEDGQSTLIMDTDSTPPPESNSPFPATHWTLVMQAAQGDQEQSQEALGELCVQYREPIRAWLHAKRPQLRNIEDVTQDFILFLLERNRVTEVKKMADRKFRSFLLKCLLRFIKDRWKKETAQKRGGGQEDLSYDEHEVGAQEDFSKLLDKKFAQEVHHKALGKLEQDHSDTGQEVRFNELQRFVLGTDADVSYADVAPRLGLNSNGMKQAVFKFRRRYLELFRNEVAQTVVPEEIEGEMRYLIGLLNG